MNNHNQEPASEYSQRKVSPPSADNLNRKNLIRLPVYTFIKNNPLKPGSRNESIVKKKRRRPRKYAPEGSHMALALTTTPSVESSDPNTPTTQKKRGRPRGSGRKQQLANCGEWKHNSAGSAFIPHIIHISEGEDVADKILSFAQQKQRALCILLGNGSVSIVTLRQFTAAGGTITYCWNQCSRVGYKFDGGTL